MCTALYMMVLYTRARVGPTTKTSDEISIICLFWLILQANPLFCFELWYSSCFNVKCWFHTFPKWCSHTPMWIPILHDNRDCHVNPFQPACFSSSGSDHFNISKIIYHFFSTVFVSSVSKLPLFFPPSLPFVFLQGLRFLLQVSILLMGIFSILFRQCSYPVISHEDTNGASSLSFFVLLSSSVVSMQAFGVDHIPSPPFKCFLMPVDLLIIHFSLFKGSGVLKISQKICVSILNSFKPFNSTGAIFLFKQSLQRCLFWVGPNPQVFFQNLTWLF